MPRVAFVGRAVEHRPWTLTAPAGGVDPVFVDVRATTPASQLTDALRDAAPDVVVVLAPGLVAPGLLGELDALKLAVLTDELAAPGEEVAEVARLPLGDYDRVVATDPRLARARSVSIWRSPPLPVDDALFRDHPPPAGPLRPLFLGASTAHRERWLVEAKHRYDLAHYAYGLEGEALAEVLGAHDVGVVVRRRPGPVAFPPTVGLHLAAGHLVISEPLGPPRGLEAGLDHLEVHEPDQLMHTLYACRHRPGAFDYVRRRGRLRAEELRASRVWPRIVRDLVLDVAAFAA